MAEQVIDAEIVSEEKIPERPREVRGPSLVTKLGTVAQSAGAAASSVASFCDSVGAHETANKVREKIATGAQIGAAASATVEAMKPAAQAVRDFGKTLEDAGILKYQKRPPLGPRNRKK